MKYSLLAIIAVLFISCNNDSEPPVEVDYSAQNEAELVKYITDNELNATKTASGLYYVVNEEGTGKRPVATSNVTVTLKGYFTDKKSFGKTDDTGLTINLQGLIKGLLEGIPFFKEGGSGTILVPARLAYGSSGTKDIPPGSVVIFDIKLLAVEHSALNDAAIVKYIADNQLTATKTASGLYYVIDEPGTGKQPISTSNVTVAYKGYYTDKTIFDAGSTTGVTFNLQQVIKGWTELHILKKEEVENFWYLLLWVMEVMIIIKFQAVRF
jgi:FKBP-type peptidyl-prolyl cis-trans isomerase